MTDILELKQQVKNLRQSFGYIDDAYSEAVAEYDAELKALREKFEFDNEDLIHNFKTRKLQMEVAEDNLRTALIESYKETGTKTFDKDLSVRVSVSFKYPTEKALEWAKTNAPFLVQEVLDKKGFEPIAKGLNPPFSFVEKVETVTAVLAKNFGE